MVIIVTCSEVHIIVGHVTGAVEVGQSTSFRIRILERRSETGPELNCFLVLSVFCCSAFPNNSLSFQTAVLLNTV